MDRTYEPLPYRCSTTHRTYFALTLNFPLNFFSSPVVHIKCPMCSFPVSTFSRTRSPFFRTHVHSVTHNGHFKLIVINLILTRLCIQWEEHHNQIFRIFNPYNSVTSLVYKTDGVLKIKSLFAKLTIYEPCPRSLSTFFPTSSALMNFILFLLINSYQFATLRLKQQKRKTSPVKVDRSDQWSLSAPETK